MKKRLLSAFLTIIMVLLLLPAALAFDTDPPMWQQCGYASQADFCIDYSFQNLIYNETVPAPPLTDAEYSEMAAYYSKMLTEVYADDRDYWAQDGWYDSKADFMSDWELMTEGEYVRHVAWSRTRDGYYWPKAEAISLAQERKDIGLTTDGVNVQVNGAYVSFPDATPELTGGRTTVPFRAIAEAMGCTVDYDVSTGTVSAARSGSRLSFVRGSNSLTRIAADGTSETIPMDIAPYEKNGRTYVPVRFFAEAYDQTVLWDDTYQIAVILDEEKLAATANTDFSVVNRLFRSDYDPAKTYRTALELAAKFTQFDSINGDTVYPLSLNATIVSQGQNLQLQLKLNIEAILDLILPELDADKDGGNQYGQEMAEMRDKLRESLKKGDLELIVNADEDTLYFKSAAITSVFKDTLPEPFDRVNDDKVWYRLSEVGVADLTGTLLPEMPTPAANVGALLYAVTCAQDQYAPYNIYADTLANAAELRAMFGDTQFKKSGSAYTIALHYDANGATGEEIDTFFEDMDMTVFDANLSITESGWMNLTLSADIDSYGDEARITAKLSGNANQADGSFMLHIKNQIKAEFTLSASQKATSDAVLSAPPTGTVVLDLNELLGVSSAA